MKQKILSLLVLLIAVSSAWAADGIACTTEDVGKLICTDGTIYATKAEAETAGKTAVAKIMVIDAANNTGLAFALAEEPGESMQWGAAEQACEGKNQSTPVAGATWAMPTKDQWNAVATAAGGFNSLVGLFGLGDRSYYWSSTDDEGNSSNAWRYDFDWKEWGSGSKTNSEARAIACLTFNVVDPNAVVVNTNAEQGETYFTEASFNMPAYDATVGFEMVRDMAQQMTTKVGDAAAGADYRVRLKKNGTAWQLADITYQQLMTLTTVHDGIEDKDLVYSGQDAVCTLQIFALDDNDQPTGDAIAFADLEPGRYKAKAVAKADGYYIGETALSNVIVLFQGYEVKVPAKEMITYYKDENLYADTETSADAQLYTVSSVSGTTVTLSEAITIVPAYTAMLVYNPTDKDETFLLIPTEDQADNITPYAGFKGTNEDMAQGATGNGPWRMAANTKYYGCNGNDFVWIKNAGAVDAHRCWIEISTANAPSRLTIVFEKEEATGVNEVSEVNEVSDDSWYDLSGRKLDGEPTEPGVYIKSGKKVVVK